MSRSQLSRTSKESNTFLKRFGGSSEEDEKEENDSVSIVTPPKPISADASNESSPSSIVEMKNLPRWLMPLELEDAVNGAVIMSDDEDDVILLEDMQSTATSRNSMARSVSFADSVVTDVRTTPRYEREDLSKMFYSKKEIQRFKWDIRFGALEGDYYCGESSEKVEEFDSDADYGAYYCFCINCYC